LSAYKHEAVVTESFEKAFRKLEDDVKERVRKRVEELLQGQAFWKPLRGPLRGLKVTRVGKWRIIFSDKKPCVIDLLDISPRETAYKRL
jgi:mRNA-degrading endonuclease RelE of RelBE toxin-antitoxin system